MVTGGAGYVGSNLVPKLLAAGYQVTVLDLYIYGDVFADLASNPNLTEVKGDLRNPSDVQRALAGCDAVIHLACISNDPSFDLEPGSRTLDQLRLLPAAGAGVQGCRRETVHLRLVVLRLRHQERPQRHRGSSA